MRKTIVSAALALASLGAGAMAVSAESVSASEAEQHPPQLHWHFEGPFGTYDRAAAQRGYQVYAEVCSACHSLQLLAYRNLMELDLTENQVKSLIKDIQVPDLGDDGQPIERPAKLSDSFRKPEQIKEFSVTKDDNFNKYFPGHKIGMPPPLADDKVQYADGTKPTLDQEASDVVQFLAWASEPHMEDRKRTGVRVILFLLAMAGLMYAVKRQVWSDKH